MFSFAMVMYELLSRSIPFEGKRDAHIAVCEELRVVYALGQGLTRWRKAVTAKVAGPEAKVDARMHKVRALASEDAGALVHACGCGSVCKVGACRRVGAAPRAREWRTLRLPLQGAAGCDCASTD